MNNKYSKYKNKYLELKKIIGGSKLEQPNFIVGQNVKFSLKKKSGKIFVGTVTFKFEGENGPMLRVQFSDGKKIDILESQGKLTDELPTISEGKDNTAAAVSLTTASTDSAAAAINIPQKAVSVPLTEDLDLINGNILYADFIKYLNLPSDDSKAIFTFTDFYPNPITLSPVLKQKFIDSYGTKQNKRWMGKTFLKKLGKKDNDLRTGSGYATWDDGISFFNAITYRPLNNSNFTGHPMDVFDVPPPVDRNGDSI